MDTQQGTPAWFSARRGKLTASRFGAAAGICPYQSRAKCLRLSLGTEEFNPGKIGTEACRWGTTNEANAVLEYMVRTGNVVTHGGFFEHPSYPWLGGSPDGFVGSRGMIEVKCPFVKQVPHIKIPPTYYCQVNGLMEILDRDWCDFVSWTPTDMKIYRVWRDPDLFGFLLDRYTTFYAFMKRGCDSVPRVTAQEKLEVLNRIEESDQHTTYDFWTYLEPGNRNGCWDGPPSDPFLTDTSDSDPEPLISKRDRNDGTGEELSVESRASKCPATGSESPGPGDVHSGPAPAVHT